MKFNLEMKFKKGDLVEVIEQDYFRGINYPKGTCWVVDHHICKDTVRVVDESQPDGTALLGTDNLRKVEEENEMKFKKGDIVEVINEDSWNGIDYIVGTKMVVDSEEDYNTVYVLDNLGNRALLYTSKLKLVERVGDADEEKEMTFKKGDVVKVIKEDEYEDIKYPLGSLWVVAEESQDGCTVRVLNHNQGEGYGILYGSRVAKVSKVNPTEKDEHPSPIYTQEEVNQLISKAYQLFDNDSQRLAYIQGYFKETHTVQYVL